MTTVQFERLQGAHIFQTGTWNGLEFDEDTLERIVERFNEMNLSGRVPLKFGHNGDQPVTDGQPALGWVERVYRRGSELLADFSDVPSAVYEAIRNGLYKFVSVELLRRKQAEEGERPDYVLDAVALLGADKPAVSNLRDLQALTMHRRGEVADSVRVVFTVADPATILKESRDIMDFEELKAKFAALEAENEKLKGTAEALQAEKHAGEVKAHRDELMAVFERGVRAEAITPGQRDHLVSLLGVNDDDKVLNVSTDDVEKLMASSRKQESGHGTRASFTRGDTAEGDDSMESKDGTPDDIVVERIEKYCREHDLDPTNWEHRRRARRHVFSKEPELGQQYMRLHDME